MNPRPTAQRFLLVTLLALVVPLLSLSPSSPARADTTVSVTFRVLPESDAPTDFEVYRASDRTLVEQGTDTNAWAVRLPAGEYLFCARRAEQKACKGGLTPATASPHQITGRTLGLGSTLFDSVSIELSNGWLRGTVTTPDGQPVAGDYTVKMIRTESGEAQPDSAYTTTLDNGYLEMELLPGVYRGGPALPGSWSTVTEGLLAGELDRQLTVGEGQVMDVSTVVAQTTRATLAVAMSGRAAVFSLCQAAGSLCTSVTVPESKSLFRTTSIQFPAVPFGEYKVQAQEPATGRSTWYGGKDKASATTVLVKPGRPAELSQWNLEKLWPTSIVALTAPTVRGKAAVGRTLRVTKGTFTTPVGRNYRWYLGTKPIRTAKGSKLRITPAMRGKKIRVVVSVMYRHAAAAYSVKAGRVRG